MLELAAEKIAQIGPISITNTMLATLLVDAFLVGVAYKFSRNVSLVPGKLQNIVEFIIEFLYNTAKEAVGSEKKTKDFFPLVATFFLLILFSNWAGLLPIFNTIGFFSSFSKDANFTPLLRPINSDLNSTLALAIISSVATQYYAIKYKGLYHHLGHYFSLNPINLFVGLLEFVSDIFTKVVSLSFRLYGNIIAGDLVIGTFSSMVGLLLPLPFMGLEVIVGFVQASVFALLTLAFTNVLTEKH